MKVLRRASVSIRVIAFSILAIFIMSLLSLDFLRLRTSDAAVLELPAPNKVLSTSPNFSLAQLKGLKVNPSDPYDLTFIIDHGDQTNINSTQAQELVRYFMAALAIPAEELWVNLSPYEGDRVIETKLEETELGEVFLKQDYILKQLSSSLTHPDSKIGKKYWKQFSIFDSQLSAKKNAFSKIWISPRESELFIKNNTVLINSASLKVETENDYLAMQKNSLNKNETNGNIKFILDELDTEVNQGKHFAQLRQVYHALILADWFKKTLKDSIYNNYINSKNVSELDLASEDIKEKVWQLYCKSFNDGVYTTVKKENNVKRSYFSGGLAMADMGVQTQVDSPKFANSALSELKVRTKTVASSAVNREAIKSSLENFGFFNSTSNNDLYDQFSRSLSVLITDKNKYNGYKKGLKDNNIAAVRDIVLLSLSNDDALQKLRILLLDKVVGKSNQTLPYASVELGRVNTLMAYVFMQSLGLKANYYESAKGPVLLINDLGNKRKDTLIVDIANGSVLKMNQAAKNVYQKNKQDFVAKNAALSKIKFEESDRYLTASKQDHNEFQLYDLVVRYPFMTKSKKLKDLRAEIVADIAYAYKRAGNIDRYVEMLKASASPRLALESTKDIIANYDKSQYRSEDQAKQKKIDQNLLKAPYNKELVKATAHFYLKRKQYEKANDLFSRLLNIEPLNAYNWFYKAEALSLIKTDSDKKRKELNDEIGRCLIASKKLFSTIVDDALSQGLLGLDLLNSYYHISPDMFEFDSGKPLNDIRYVLNMFRQAAKNERNSVITKQIDFINNKIDNGAKSISGDLAKLRDLGLSGKLAMGIMKLSEKYSTYITARDAELANQKAQAEHKEKLAQQEEVVRQAQEKAAAEEARAQAALKEIDVLQTELRVSKQEADEQREVVEKLSRDLNSLDGHYDKIYKESLKYRKKGPELKEGQKARDYSIRGTLQRSLRELSDNLNIVVENYTLSKNQEGSTLFLAEAKHGLKDKSFYEDTPKVAKGTEKELVAELYSYYMSVEPAKRSVLIDNLNKKYNEFLYVYESNGTFNVIIHTRSKVPQKYRTTKDSSGKTALENDLIKYSRDAQLLSKIPEEKLDTIAFTFVNEKDLYMWSDWHVESDGKFNPKQLISSESVTLRRHFAESIVHWNRGRNKYVETVHALEKKEDAELQAASLENKLGDLEKANADLVTKTLTSAKTGLFNETYFQQRIPELLAAGQRVFVSFGDLDKFKNINDGIGITNPAVKRLYSQKTGDLAIQFVGAKLKQVLDKTLGENGEAIHLSGDEFASIIKGVDIANAAQAIENVRHEVEIGSFAFREKQGPNVGKAKKAVTEYVPVSEINEDDLQRNNIIIHPLRSSHGLFEITDPNMTAQEVRNYAEDLGKLAKKLKDLKDPNDPGKNIVIFEDSGVLKTFQDGQPIELEKVVKEKMGLTVEQFRNLVVEDEREAGESSADESENLDETLEIVEDEKVAEEPKEEIKVPQTTLEKMKADIEHEQIESALDELALYADDLEALKLKVKEVSSKGEELDAVNSEFADYVRILKRELTVYEADKHGDVRNDAASLRQAILDANNVVNEHNKELDGKESLLNNLVVMKGTYRDLVAEISNIDVLDSRSDAYSERYKNMQHLFSQSRLLIKKHEASFDNDIKRAILDLKSTLADKELFLNEDHDIRMSTLAIQDQLQSSANDLRNFIAVYKQQLVEISNGLNDLSADTLNRIQVNRIQKQRNIIAKYVLDEVDQLIKTLRENKLGIDVKEIRELVKHVALQYSKVSSARTVSRSKASNEEEFNVLKDRVLETLKDFKSETEVDQSEFIKMLKGLSVLLDSSVENISKDEVENEDPHSVFIDTFLEDVEEDMSEQSFQVKAEFVSVSLKHEFDLQLANYVYADFEAKSEIAETLKSALEQLAGMISADLNSNAAIVQKFAESIKELCGPVAKLVDNFADLSLERKTFEEQVSAQWTFVDQAATDYLKELEAGENIDKLKQRYKLAVETFNNTAAQETEAFSEEELTNLRSKAAAQIEQMQAKIEEAKEEMIKKSKAQKKAEAQEALKDSDLDLRLNQLPDNDAMAMQELFTPNAYNNIYNLFALANGDIDAINAVMVKTAKIINKNSRTYFNSLRKEFSRTNQEGYTTSKLKGEVEQNELFFRDLFNEQGKILWYVAEYLKAYKYVQNNIGSLVDNKEELIEELFKDAFVPLAAVAADIKTYINEGKLVISLRKMEELERDFYIGESTIHWFKTALGQQLFTSGFFGENDSEDESVYLDVADIEQLQKSYHESVAKLLDLRVNDEFSTEPVRGFAYSSKAQQGMHNDSGLMMSAVKWFKDKVADRDGQGTILNTILTQTFDEQIFKMQGDNVEGVDVFFLRLEDDVYNRGENLDVYAHDNDNHRYMILDKEDVDFYDNIDLLGRTLEWRLNQPEYINSDKARFIKDYFRKLMLNELGQFMKLEKSFEEYITEAKLSPEQANLIVDQYINVMEKNITGINSANKALKDHFQILGDNLTPSQIINAATAKISQVLPAQCKDLSQDIAMSDKNRKRYFDKVFEIYQAYLMSTGQNVNFKLNFDKMKSLWQKSALHPRFHRFNVRYAKRLLGLVLQMHGVEAKDTEKAKRIITSLYKTSKEAADPEEIEEIIKYESELVNKLSSHSGEYAEVGVEVIFPEGTFAQKAIEQETIQEEQAVLKEQALQLLITNTNKQWEVVQSQANKYFEILNSGQLNQSIKTDYIGAWNIMKDQLPVKFKKYYSEDEFNKMFFDYESKILELNTQMHSLEEAIKEKAKQAQEAEAAKQAEEAEAARQAEEARQAQEAEAAKLAEEKQQLDDFYTAFENIKVIADALISAYKNDVEDVKELEDSFDATKTGLEGSIKTLKDKINDLADIIETKDSLDSSVELAKDQYNERMDLFAEFDSSSAITKVNGGLDMGQINSTRVGEFAGFNINAKSIKQESTMSFELVYFKSIDQKTVLASL